MMSHLLFLQRQGVSNTSKNSTNGYQTCFETWNSPASNLWKVTLRLMVINPLNKNSGVEHVVFCRSKSNNLTLWLLQGDEERQLGIPVSPMCELGPAEFLSGCHNRGLYTAVGVWGTPQTGAFFPSKSLFCWVFGNESTCVWAIYFLGIHLCGPWFQDKTPASHVGFHFSGCYMIYPQDVLISFSRWWFQRFLFSTWFGEDPHFD